ncbi:MAG: hypothetical protein GX945_11065 [Lentisphaerae bacterium]|nr:hypothetical protein [Lentisphaerota bacterium]
MKWTYLWLGSIILFIVSVIVIILLKVLLLTNLPIAYWWVPAASSLLFFTSMKQSAAEWAAALRHSYRDFLEYDKTFQRVSTFDYPSNYVQAIDRASKDLTNAGMMVIGDFSSPPDEAGNLGKKIFVRILRSPDSMVWAEVKRIRPTLLLRWAATLCGLRNNFQTITEVFIYFRYGNVLIVSNAKMSSPRPIPGIQREERPKQSPHELLQTAMEWKLMIENNGENPAKCLDLESFQKSSYATEIYLQSKVGGFEFPSAKTWKREGFSDSAIEKYRKICLDFLPASEENTADTAAASDAPEAGEDKA